MTPLLIWIAVPLLGAAIGYLTNRLAVAMIFRPIRPRRILGLRVQGLIGRRQAELADSIGRVVGRHLVSHDDVVRSFERVDLTKLLHEVLEQGMAPKVAELRSLPLIGGFLTDDRITELRAAIARGIVEHRALLFEKLERAVEEGLDVQQVVTDKVADFSVEKLETLVLEVARRELRAIELLGGVLGLLIGVAQAALVTLA